MFSLKRTGVVLLCLLSSAAFSQQLRLGKTPLALQKSAILELESDNQGLLLSSISDTVLINNLTPPDGMVIFHTPSAQLMVRSNGAWRSLGTTAAMANYWNQNGNITGSVKKLGSTDNFDLSLVTNNAERMRILNNGNIGIGQATPGNLLEVAGTTAGTGVSGIRLTNLGTATPAASNAKMLTVNANGDIVVANNNANNAWSMDGNTTGAVKKIGSTDAFATSFITNNTERIRILSTGNVGIGQAAPGNILEVAGTNTTTGVSGLRLTNLGTATPATTNTKMLTVNSTGDVVVANNNSWTTDGNTNGADKKLGTIDNYAIAFITSNTERARIDNNGNLGVGTSTPSAVMDVNGTYRNGAKGTVQKNTISFEATLGTATSLGTATLVIVGLGYAPAETDFNITIPAANQPTTTRATVTVSFDRDLPASVSIEAARLTTTSNVKIRLANAGTAAQTLASGTKFYITITEF